jgi:biotin carboxyl carrier protein
MFAPRSWPVLEVVVNEGDQIGGGHPGAAGVVKMEIPVLAEVAGTVQQGEVSVGDVIGPATIAVIS